MQVPFGCAAHIKSHAECNQQFVGFLPIICWRSPAAHDVSCAGAGLRIFRLLKAKRQLEQKQVAEQAVLPPKEANVTLYTLLKGGFVCIQVPAPCALRQLMQHARREGLN